MARYSMEVAVNLLENGGKACAKDVRRQTNRRKRRRGPSQGHRNGHEKRIACRPNQDEVASQGLSWAFGVRVLAKCSHARYCVPTRPGGGAGTVRASRSPSTLLPRELSSPAGAGVGRLEETSNRSPAETEPVWAIFRHEPPAANSKGGLVRI